MANPVVLDVPVNTWVKVATNVTFGMIYPLIGGSVKYYFTIRDTGGAAPSDFSEQKEMDYAGAEIQSSTAIDVYVTVSNYDGKVRVDL